MASFLARESDSKETAMPKFNSWREAWTHVDRVVSVGTPALKVTVSEPEVAGYLMNKYVSYLIRTEPFGFVVRRRFSDFAWLRETLAKRYIGMLLPSLPKKSVIGAGLSSTGSEFIKNRMRLLGLFIENLVLIPFVRSDAALLSFLSVQNEKDWDKARSSPEAVRDLFQDTTIGAVKWRQLITDETQTVVYSERAIMDVWKQIERIEQTLSPLCASCKILSERTSLVVTDMMALKTGFSDWNKVEADFMNSSRWEYPSREGHHIASMLSQSTTLFEKWVEVLQYQPLIFEHVCHDALQYLEQQVDAFRELLRARERAVKERAKYDRELQNVLAEKARTAADNSILGSFSLMGKEHSEEDLVRLIKDKENAVKCYTRALFFSEIDRFNADRAAVTKAVLSQLAACTVQFNKKVNGLWSEAVSNMDLDVTGGVEAAKMIMSSTSAVKIAGTKDA